MTENMIAPDSIHDRPRVSRPIIAASAFTALYVLTASIMALAAGNTEFIFYIIVMLVLISAVCLLHWHYPLSAGLLWGLSIWGALHMAGGLVTLPPRWPIGGENHVLYSLWLIPKAGASGADSMGYLKYDQVVHAYGFGMTTWLCWQALRAGLYKKYHIVIEANFRSMLLCVMAACGFGAFNEIIEFMATLFADTNVGGYVNTGIDLCANMIGAIIVAILIAIFTKRT